MGEEARWKGEKERERAWRGEKAGIENRFGRRRMEERKKDIARSQGEEESWSWFRFDAGR